MTDFIQKLVAQKAKKQVAMLETGNDISKDDRPVDIQTAWQTLTDKPLYLLEVEIITGVKQSLGLDTADLGLDPELVEGLAGGYRAKISQRLKDARNKLSAAQKIFYRQLSVYAPPFRFVLEERLEEALEHIDHMEQQAQQLRAELVADYETEAEAFLVDLETRLQKVVPTDQPNRDRDIEAALTSYAEEFPSLDDFADCLQIVVKGPTKLTSLAEQIKRDQALQAELADQEKAIAQNRLEATRLETERKAAELLQRNLISAVYASQTTCKEEAYELVGEFLDRTDSRQAGQLTSRDTEALSTLFNRLDLLAAHNPGLQDLVDQARSLKKLYAQKSPDIDQVQKAVEQFQEYLKTQVDRETSGSTGLQKLTRSLSFSANYKALTQELEQLAIKPDPTRLQELEGKVQSDLDVLKLRQRRLVSLHKKAMEAAKAKAQETPTADQPFDTVAGF